MSSSSLCEKSQAELNDALRDWFSRGAGARLLDAEQTLLARLSEDVFGYHLVQVQDYGHTLDAFADCPVKYRSLLDRGGDSTAGVSARALSEQLPLASDAVDLVVLPHTLDFSLDPHLVLREAERILIPEGRVLIVGFNPISLWGLWRGVLRWRGNVPWCGRFLSYRRIVDWLVLLGFDIEYSDVCAFAPPLDSDTWARRVGRGENLGRRVWPMLAGVYVVRAVKRVSTIRPIKSGWSSLRVFGPSAIEPSARNGVNRTTE